MVIGDSDGDGDHVIGGNKLGDWFWCQDVWSPRSPVDLVTYPPVTYLVTYALFPNSLKEPQHRHTPAEEQGAWSSHEDPAGTQQTVLTPKVQTYPNKLRNSRFLELVS